MFVFLFQTAVRNGPLERKENSSIKKLSLLPRKLNVNAESAFAI